MKNNATRTIRSEEITIDVRICAALAANRGGEVYLAAIAPDMELTVITLDEAPDILPCFATTMRPFCPQFEIFRLEKNAMLTLEWIGKNKVVNHHQEVPFRVLERQYSFDEQGQHTENNDSENMIIHGDNLEALKALLPQYEGKVKCIYIVLS